jgi:LysR family transcriptional regulator, glycine cleavage system transcriptional activator
MRRGRLPLTALRSFESAGRLLSFTQAAEELFVTQAAISRQIRELERSLGLGLFERHHRSVSLTENGARLLARLTQSFDEIDGALRQMPPSSAASSLVVSVEPGFAACWLVPRLDRFRALQPGIDVEILSDSRVIEFRTSRAELAIRHSASATGWPRVEAQRLARAVVTPVLSPALLAHGPPLLHPEDLAGHTLLHEDGRRYWAVWMERAGIVSPQTARGPLFNDGALVIPAALRGHGVALGDLVLVKDDIEAGRLIAPFDLTVSLGSYWLVAPRFDRLSPAARIFADWLHDAIS